MQDRGPSLRAGWWGDGRGCPEGTDGVTGTESRVRRRKGRDREGRDEGLGSEGPGAAERGAGTGSRSGGPGGHTAGWDLLSPMGKGLEGFEKGPAWCFFHRGSPDHGVDRPHTHRI